MDMLINSLKSNNYKVTPQRIAVYHEIHNSKDHPNAETIHKNLAPKYPSISLATVYKSLELFAKLGIIQIINIDGQSYRYDSNTEKHHHIICNKCNKIEDLDNKHFACLKSEIENLTQYKIINQNFCFYGICKSCANSMEN
ncbi:MAG: transcriptional repressor [Clostridiales bacterium]|nr:transcriptional repressor [Clostridiales bacterium]